MSDEAVDRREAQLPERGAFLVLLAMPAVIWLIYFVVVYSAAAVWCARFAGEDDSLGPIRPAAFALTAAVLAVIAWIGWHGYRRHRHGSETVPHDMDTPEDRHRFLGFATLLLAGLSAIATIYTAMAMVFIETCW